MASEHSTPSGYESESSSPEHDNYGRIHHTNTAGLSLLFEPLPHTPIPNLNAILDTYGTPPPRWSASPSPSPTPSSPSYSPSPSPQPSPIPPPPSTPPSPTPAPPTWPPPPLLPIAPRAHPFPQQWQSTPYPPIDEDALAQHDPFLLAEEWGGNRICDRGCLFWIEGRRLPGLVDLGLDRFLALGGGPSVKVRRRDFWGVVQ